MKIDRAKIAKQAKCTRQQIDHILSGRRKASSGMAERLEKITGVNRTVWVWGTPNEIKEALEKQYCKAA